MLEISVLVLAAGAIAALVTNLLVPFVTSMCRKLSILDHPGKRKMHKEPVATLGGIAIFAGVFFGTAAALVLGGWGSLEALDRHRFAPLIVGTTMIFMLGVVDDMVALSALKKFVVQCAAAWLVVRGNWSVEVLRIPFFENAIELGAASEPLSILWIVGVVNAINLIDGLDGLASGIAAIISLSFLVYAAMSDVNVFTLVVMGAIVGSCLGFLRHNWAPAQIYLGDSGALTLGFLLAVSSIRFKTSAAVAILVPILALGVPVMDTVLVMISRFFENPKSGLIKNAFRIFRADRNHLHHYLLHFNISRKQVVVGLYFVVFLFCALGIVAALNKRFFLGMALILIEFGVVAAMRFFGLNRKLANEKKAATQ